MEVIFFPRNDYPNNIEICNHRLGRVMTYTEQTDGYNIIYQGQNTFRLFMNLAKVRNIKVGCFLGLSVPINDFDGLLKQDYVDGKLWLDAYSYTTELAPKITTGQPITEEEWDNAYTTTLLPNFYNFLKKKPVALSYSYGNATFADYVIPKLLCARNSGRNQDTDYGVGFGNPSNLPYSITRYKSKQSSTRWYDAAKENNDNFAEQLAIQSDLIDTTLQNGGWLNNFTHWHNYWQNGDEEWAEPYLNLLQSKNANNQIYFAGYGEAVAYLVYRQIVTKAVMYSPNSNPNTQLVIRLETDNTLSIDTDLLQVPISIKFSTVGTPLENHNIKCDARNLIGLGNNEYIIEIPFSRFPTAIIEKAN